MKNSKWVDLFKHLCLISLCDHSDLVLMETHACTVHVCVCVCVLKLSGCIFFSAVFWFKEDNLLLQSMFAYSSLQ